jgi:hypothetical protein
MERVLLPRNANSNQRRSFEEDLRNESARNATLDSFDFALSGKLPNGIMSLPNCMYAVSDGETDGVVCPDFLEQIDPDTDPYIEGYAGDMLKADFIIEETSTGRGWTNTPGKPTRTQRATSTIGKAAAAKAAAKEVADLTGSGASGSGSGGGTSAEKSTMKAGWFEGDRMVNPRKKVSKDIRVAAMKAEGIFKSHLDQTVGLIWNGVTEEFQRRLCEIPLFTEAFSKSRPDIMMFIIDHQLINNTLSTVVSTSMNLTLLTQVEEHRKTKLTDVEKFSEFIDGFKRRWTALHKAGYQPDCSVHNDYEDGLILYMACNIGYFKDYIDKLIDKAELQSPHCSLEKAERDLRLWYDLHQAKVKSLEDYATATETVTEASIKQANTTHSNQNNGKGSGKSNTNAKPKGGGAAGGKGKGKGNSNGNTAGKKDGGGAAGGKGTQSKSKILCVWCKSGEHWVQNCTTCPQPVKEAYLKQWKDSQSK